MAMPLVRRPGGNRDWVRAAEWPTGWTHLPKINVKEAWNKSWEQYRAAGASRDGRH
jgi:hypothetical protein